MSGVDHALFLFPASSVDHALFLFPASGVDHALFLFPASSVDHALFLFPVYSVDHALFLFPVYSVDHALFLFPVYSVDHAVTVLFPVSRVDHALTVASAKVQKVISFAWDSDYTCTTRRYKVSLAAAIRAEADRPMIANCSYHSPANKSIVVIGYNLQGLQQGFQVWLLYPYKREQL